MGRVFCSSAVFGFLKPNQPCLALVCSGVDSCSLSRYKPYFICHTKLRVMSRPCGYFSPYHHMDEAVWPWQIQAASVTAVDPKVALQ